MLFKKKKKPVYEMRLERYFDNHSAQIAYQLVKYEIEKGKVKDFPYWLGSGDAAWAKKIAKHYGLSITEPIHEDD